MISREQAEAYRLQILAVPFQTKVEQLAMIHYGDGDELGVLARTILFEIDPVRYADQRMMEAP